MAKSAAAGLEPIDRLEEKIKTLVSLIGRLKNEQARVADENGRLLREMEALKARLATHDAHGLGQAQARLDQGMGDLLRKDVVHTDRQPEGLSRRAPFHGVHQLLAHAEDVLGVAKDQSAHLGGNQSPARAAQQLLAKLLLQAAELGANRRRSQAQLLAGTSDATSAHDLPEVEEVVIVQPLHGAYTLC